MIDQKFTPALGYQRLTPLYDSAIGLLTREKTWRRLLVELIEPLPGDRILDVGCGTGSLAILIASHERECQVIGLDPDPAVLAIAKRKTDRSVIAIDWKNGFLTPDVVDSIGPVSKVVSSLVLHQTSLPEKLEILRAMRSVLGEAGKLAIADYGQQRTTAMRFLFRATVQMLDGVADTQPNADGCLLELIEEAGFDRIIEKTIVPTVTGSISLYQASC